jgi:aspartyl-tRNA(Asn)/glutamyl-tRNA(Gln) amidotransferase subunit B
MKQLLVFAGISDCSMEKGSLRVDANLSVRPLGQATLGTKTEVKNMNSFANVERALEAERLRQIALIEGGGEVRQVSLLFNAAAGTVRPMRSKEDSHDYRYFPDPDLPPLVLTEEWIEAERAALPELPEAMRARLASQYGLSPYDAQVLTAEAEISRYFEGVVAAGADGKVAANWVMGEALSDWNAAGSFRVAPADLAGLIALVADATLSHQAAKKVYVELSARGGNPLAVAKELGLVQVRDTAVLEGWVDEVLAAHPDEVARFKGGETKLTGFFTGQVMKRSGGKADPKGIQAVLVRTLS